MRPSDVLSLPQDEDDFLTHAILKHRNNKQEE